MRVLISGVSGFIGTHLARACLVAGHEVIGAGRQRPAGLPGLRHLPLDYTALPPVEALARELQCIDVAVNAVGILRQHGARTFEALHVRGPRVLFAAAAAARVRRIIQVSALGAEPEAVSGYHRSKSEADRTLMASSLDWAIVLPSLVYGPGGSSAGLFNLLASLPITPLPAGGTMRVQPVHIDDVTAGLLKLIESPAELRCALPMVGPVPLTLAEFLRELRATLGFRRTFSLSVPRVLVATAARVGDYLPGVFLSRETFGMLERGNVGDAGPFTRLLGRPPLPVPGFVNSTDRPRAHREAVLTWTLPLLRLTVAFMWLIAGIVSLVPGSFEHGLALLRDIGIPASLAPVVLGCASGLDIALGLLTLAPRRLPLLWVAQILVVLGYTSIISVFLPALWLEPFGPVAKNVPILALLVLLWQLEPRR
ncbi:MAG TPA: SDR family oxidoreductase [Steroidobacteraceae bacterium]|nr:SDR family oxidoreductase [Steroidobacteraceae bacterium]